MSASSIDSYRRDVGEVSGAPIHVVEPNLETAAGHGFSFVASLCDVRERPRLALWVNRRADVVFPQAAVDVHAHFVRRIRRIQAYFLYRRLLRAPGRIFVSTAGRVDLTLLDWAARSPVPPDKAYFFFHWFNANERKMHALRRLAARQPNVQILAPTPTIIAAFREAGFRHCHVVPYPISATVPGTPGGDPAFARLLYAGAARQDKGFAHVVNLIDHLAKRNADIPVTIQASAEHYGKLDAATKADIARLQEFRYPALTIEPDTLSPADYHRLFAGAICLQLYRTPDFADRVSGVTLDALCAGAPIVALAGTWIARVVARFQAGVVVDNPTPSDLDAIVRKIVSDYARFSALARSGGEELRREHGADAILRVMTDS